MQTQANNNNNLVQSLFIKLLALIYFLAFTSLLPQIKGLIGINGILPVQNFLNQILASAGSKAYTTLPTIFWLDASDNYMIAACLLGMLFSISLFFGFYTRLTLISNWALYLSFLSVSRVFLAYQWDILLLETGFLAIFLAFLPASKSILWLTRFLLFKLMFMSGLVKILSGDPSWQKLTALDYHYFTQPIPNPLSWLIDKLPTIIDKASILIMFAIELLCPFLIFAKARARLIAFYAFVLLQLLIIISGNYCFFNLLTLALSTLLLEDRHLSVLPKRIVSFLNGDGQTKTPKFKIINSTISISLFIVLMTLNSFYLINKIVPSFKMPNLVTELVHKTYPWHLSSAYGLFAVMTKERNEIIIEASNDGKEWLAYEFHWKVGKLKKLPGQVAPHQPRLDWQMWFTALRGFNQSSNGWFMAFIEKLLVGEKEVLKLLAFNPFPDKPPKYIRASFYRYKFSSLKEFTESGQYWTREYIGKFMPAVSLQISNSEKQ